MPSGAPAETDARPRVFLAASPGGHMQLLRSVDAAFQEHERTWVTAPGSHADDLAAAGERVILLPRVKGVPKIDAVRNLRAAAGLVARHRPELVVTSGADLVVPFCVLARAAGAQIISPRR